jgi:hypothetical protein
VPLGNLKGDALANALTKSETKAKRRVTLSIAGLGWLDETELETIQHQNITSNDVVLLPAGEEHAQSPAERHPTEDNSKLWQQLTQVMKLIGEAIAGCETCHGAEQCARCQTFRAWLEA